MLFIFLLISNGWIQSANLGSCHIAKATIGCCLHHLSSILISFTSRVDDDRSSMLIYWINRLSSIRRGQVIHNVIASNWLLGLSLSLTSEDTFLILIWNRSLDIHIDIYVSRCLWSTWVNIVKLILIFILNTRQERLW